MIQWQWQLTWSINVPCHDTLQHHHVFLRQCWPCQQENNAEAMKMTKRTRKWFHSARGGACHGMALPTCLVDCWILDSLKLGLTRIFPSWSCSKILPKDPLQPPSHPIEFRNRPLIIYLELHLTQGTNIPRQLILLKWVYGKLNIRGLCFCQHTPLLYQLFRLSRLEPQLQQWHSNQKFMAGAVLSSSFTFFFFAILAMHLGQSFFLCSSLPHS